MSLVRTPASRRSIHPTGGGFEHVASRFSLVAALRRTGSGNSSVFRLVATTILRASSKPLPWKLIFRYVPTAPSTCLNGSTTTVRMSRIGSRCIHCSP
jgi:hypothetical protein